MENIDDLGICSSFVAGLPTTDVYFTGVGRYSPLTDQPILRAAHAYLLYQDVQFVIARADLLWRANGDRWPDTLLDGYFVRAGGDVSNLASVASIFVSRIDTAVDKRFDQVDNGFIEMRGRLDAAAAGQQQIVDILQRLIANQG